MTNIFYPPSQNAIQKTLDAQLLSGITASMTLNNVTGIQNKPGVCVVDLIDANGNFTPAKREYIKFTGVSGNTLTGLTRNADGGGSDQDHAVGAIVQFPADIIQQQALIDTFEVEHTDEGVHTDALVTSLKASGAEVNTGTEDTKIVTPKALADSDYAKTSDIPVTLDNTVELENKTIDYTKNTLTNLPTGTVGISQQAIINGNFDVWQRGTTSAVLDTVNTYVADRWRNLIFRDGGTLPTLTASRQAFTPGELANSFYFHRVATNGAGTSLGNSSYYQFLQRIENGTRNLCGDGKKVTVSFYARSSIENKRIGIMLLQHYGTGGSPTAAEKIITQEPITLTSTLTKYTVTFTTNTLSGKTFGTANDDRLEVIFYLQWGSTFGNTDVYPSVTAETYIGSGNIDIAQVQLCAGDVALPFMPKSFEEELRACQRYYEKSFDYTTTPADNAGLLGAIGMTNSATGNYNPVGRVTYTVRKRIAVTPTLYNPSASSANKIRTSAGTDHPGTTDLRGESGFIIYVNNSATNAGNVVSTHYTSEAEL